MRNDPRPPFLPSSPPRTSRIPLTGALRFAAFALAAMSLVLGCDLFEDDGAESTEAPTEEPVKEPTEGPGESKAPDRDNDGLSDDDEAVWGTDPDRMDTDGDTLVDGDEVHRWGTDPLSADSDGDGWDDGLELRKGRDPNIADTLVTPSQQLPPDQGWADCDGDGQPDLVGPEICNGIDDDCDGYTDEGFNGGDDDGDGVLDCLEPEDCDCVDDDGDGLIAEHCVYEVRTTYLARQFASTPGGSNTYGLERSFVERHTGSARETRHWVVESAVQNQAHKTVFRAVITANGQTIARTGDLTGDWATFPGADYTSLPADTDTGPPLEMLPWSCAPSSDWSGPIVDSHGAMPAWPATHSGGCAAGFNGVIRVRYPLCGNIETCDGIDNDGDGLTDEDTPDADGDGICDLFDWDECDGFDNDGDGQIDEDGIDRNQNGVCDALEAEVEVCDGIDNDGDGFIDEGPDLNFDGISDCLQNRCDDSNETLMAILGTGSFRQVRPWTGNYTEVTRPSGNFYDLVVTEDSRVFALARFGNFDLYIVEIFWGPIVSVGRRVRLPVGFPNPAEAASNYVGLTTAEDGGLLIGIDTTIYHMPLAPHFGPGGNAAPHNATTTPPVATLTPVVSAPHFHHIRDMGWHAGILYVAAWGQTGYLGGPGIYTFNRLRGQLEIAVPPDSFVLGPAHFSPAQMRPSSMAFGADGDAFLNMEQSFQWYSGAETNSVFAWLPSLGSSWIRLWRFSGYPSSESLDTAVFPGGHCQMRVESCDGIDNDGDGLTDEGFDSDQDGMPDCFFDECDGIDNDGDGLTDEDVPDADGDGICDGRDIETCDGIDNDGDGQTDEVDLDGDATIECGLDVCATLPDLTWLMEGWAHNGGTRLRQLDLTSKTWDGGISSSAWVGDLAVGPDLEVLGVGRSNSKVALYQLEPATGRSLLLSVSPWNAPYPLYSMGIAIEPGGDVLIAFADRLVRWSRATQTWAIETLLPNHGELRNLAWRNGRLQILSGGGLWEYDRTTGTTTHIAQPAGILLGATALPDGTQLMGQRWSSGAALAAWDPIDDRVSTYLAPSVIPHGLGGIWDYCESTVEICDGLDNDGDGQIDEGAPDTDGDGIPDCLDTETCDGLDNDGDGSVDEGFPDTDGDGIADCVDKETCNCQDDDGNGIVDDGCTYELTMAMSAAGSYKAWLDGANLSGGGKAGVVGMATVPLTVGTHQVAILSTVTDGRAMMAKLWLSGRPIGTTAGPGWVASETMQPGWQTNPVGFSAPWSAYDPGYSSTDWLEAQGVPWIWSTIPNKANEVGYFVYTFEACGPETNPELCDGIDNDGDGQIDEGFSDGNNNGKPDCLEPVVPSTGPGPR